MDFKDDIPVIHTTIAGTRIVGRLTAGNKNGLLVPSTTTDKELQDLRNSLPDEIKIQRIDEKLSALGNVIAVNDHVALVHHQIERETEEVIADVLGVEVFRETIGPNDLCGSYCALSNLGALVPPNVKTQARESLAQLLQVPVCSGTVSRGSSVISAGLIVNDWKAYAGMNTTSAEISVVEGIFQLHGDKTDHFSDLRNPLIEVI